MIKDNRKKYIIFIITLVVLLVALIASGTYAWVTFIANVTNGNYEGYSGCFDINYSSTDISGTLWPRLHASDGLSSTITMGKTSECIDTPGTGTITLNVNNTTDSVYYNEVEAHCENVDTLETMHNYTTSSSCSSAGGTWVTNGTALKYAVYTNASGSGIPLSKGYINNSGNINVYTGFEVPTTNTNYYLFIWLDGWFIDNTYADLTFSGNLYAEAIQHD